MRILLIHNRYGATTRGGAERVVERLARDLTDRGHTVTVAVPCPARIYNTFPAAAGKVLYFKKLFAPNIVPFDRLGRIPAPIRAIWHLIDLCNLVAAVRLRTLLRRTKPDVVHTHNLIGCGGLTPWVIRRSGIPWVHTLHDVQLITPSGLLRESVGAPFHGHPRAGMEPRPYVPVHTIERSFFGRSFRALRRFLFGSPTVVTSPSRWLLELHRSERFFPRSRDAVTGNPVDVSRIMRMNRADDADMRIPQGNIARIRSAYPHHRHNRSASSVLPIRTFLFLGQVEGVKGILVLVEAFRQLRSLYDDVSLHVVGDGTLLPTLKRMSRDMRGLVLRGRLDADGVRTALAESDVLVVPSLCAENQPSAILEAYAAGVPVIASHVGGIPEIIREGETGFLVDPGSVEDLLRALRACVEDPKRIRAMATACHAVAAEHAVDHIVGQFEGVYRDVQHSMLDRSV